MTVKTLELCAFRNYETLSASFSPGVNLIYGENAQGKTNLLEAVEYLSGCRTHRARTDGELLSFCAQTGRIRALVDSSQREFSLDICLRRGARRTITINGVRQKTAASLSELLHTVLFCPEDLSMIRAGASTRRRFLDNSICQLRPRYALALAEYNRLYEHKTRILRDWEQKPSLLETLDDFNLRLARTGAVVIHYRAHFIRKLFSFAAAIHRDFSGGREALTVDYQTVKTIQDPFASVEALSLDLLEHLQSHRKAELEARVCLSGPHKDDLLLCINGQPSRQFASQGQARTAALALKLAERELHREDTGYWPVLLLDDVLSELDQRRRDYILGQITEGQVFITCCEDAGLLTAEGGSTFRICEGRIVD